MPPGICACQWAGAASGLLSAALGDELPVPEPEEDDDHAPGCPASHLAQGMGVKPPAGPTHPALDLGPSLATPTTALPAPVTGPAGPRAAFPPDPASVPRPLYLSLRTLII